MTTAERFTAAETRAELEQAFRDLDRGQAAGALDGPDPIAAAVASDVAFAVDQYEERGILTRAEAEDLRTFATAAALRAERESIATTVAAWVAGKEGAAS